MTNEPIRPFRMQLISLRPAGGGLGGSEREPIASSFESAATRLQMLAKLYFEPDGSFVWCRDGGKEQLFGMLYDAAGQIQYCELQGKCTLSTWVTIRKEILGGAETSRLHALRLPEQDLQDLQTFEESVWGQSDIARVEN